MSTTPEALSKNEVARRGNEIYENQIRELVQEKHHGEIVAIDVQTGDWAIDPQILGATDKLRETHPDALPFIVRVGYRTVHTFGSRVRRV